MLASELRWISALDVTRVGDRNKRVDVGDQIFIFKFGVCARNNFSAALVPVFFFYFQSFAFDHRINQGFAVQDFAKFFDQCENRFVLVDNLVTLEAGEALETHFQDRLCLDLRKTETRDQLCSRLIRTLRRFDQRDHFVDILNSAFQAFQDVRSGFGFAKFEHRSANDHVLAMLDECPEHISQVERAWLTLMDRQQINSVVFLKLRELVQAVEKNVGVLALLQLDNNTHSLAIGFIAKIGNSFDLLITNEVGNLFDQTGLVHLVGEFGHDDSFTIRFVGFNLCARTQSNCAAASAVSFANVWSAEHESGRWKVWALHILKKSVRVQARIINQCDRRIDNFSKIVRGNACRHPDCDPRGSVHE